MNEFMYAQREIGDYRISVYYDDNASCPYEDFDEVGLFLYETCRSHFLAGNTESVWPSRTLEGALRDLVWKYVDLPDETSPQDLEKDELIDLLNSQEDFSLYRMDFSRILPGRLCLWCCFLHRRTLQADGRH